MGNSGKLSPADEEIFSIDTILDNLEKNKNVDSEDSINDTGCSEVDGIKCITYTQYRELVPENEECYLLFEGSRVTLDELCTIVRNQKEIYNVDILNGNFNIPNCVETEVGLDANSIAMATMYDFIESGEVLSDIAIAEITKLCGNWNKKHAIKKISKGNYVINIEKELIELEEKYKNEVYEF